MQQNLKHALARGGVLPQGLVRRNGNLLVRPAPFVSQSRLIHPQLTLFQAHPARLRSVPDQVRPASFPLVRRPSPLYGRQLENGFDADVPSRR